MANVLANSIKDKEHLKAWDEVSEERLNAIDFSALIPLLIDTAPVEMLPYLAEQFNVLGYNGWRYADTEQKQRDMIKNAIPLKKFKGTLWSVKEALKFINVEPITIRKDPYDYYPNGLWRCNGHFTCGNDNPFKIGRAHV